MSQLTAVEKKAKYDSLKASAISAGITDKKIISMVASEKISLEEALKAQEPAPKTAEGSNEQNVAGDKPGQTAGGANQEGAGESQSAATQASAEPKNDSSEPKEEKVKKGDKVYIVNRNILFNGSTYNKGAAISKDDAGFEEFKKSGFLD